MRQLQPSEYRLNDRELRVLLLGKDFVEREEREREEQVRREEEGRRRCEEERAQRERVVEEQRWEEEKAELLKIRQERWTWEKMQMQRAPEEPSRLLFDPAAAGDEHSVALPLLPQRRRLASPPSWGPAATACEEGELGNSNQQGGHDEKTTTAAADGISCKGGNEEQHPPSSTTVRMLGIKGKLEQPGSKRISMVRAKAPVVPFRPSVTAVSRFTAGCPATLPAAGQTPKDSKVTAERRRTAPVALTEFALPLLVNRHGTGRDGRSVGFSCAPPLVGVMPSSRKFKAAGSDAVAESKDHAFCSRPAIATDGGLASDPPSSASAPATDGRASQKSRFSKEGFMTRSTAEIPATDAGCAAGDHESLNTSTCSCPRHSHQWPLLSEKQQAEEAVITARKTCSLQLPRFKLLDASGFGDVVAAAAAKTADATSALSPLGMTQKAAGPDGVASQKRALKLRFGADGKSGHFGEGRMTCEEAAAEAAATDREAKAAAAALGGGGGGGGGSAHWPAFSRATWWTDDERREQSMLMLRVVGQRPPPLRVS